MCFLFLLGTAFSQGIKTSKTSFGKSLITKKINPNNGLIRCSSVEYEKMLQEKDPKRLTDEQFEAWITPLVAKYKAMRTNSKIAVPVTIDTIPVVVHVIYNGQAIGVAPNITDAQVQSQITVLNQDYRRMIGTKGYNNKLVGADTQIQFVLAKVDPNGNPTNGIDRVSFCQKSWTVTDIDAIIKPSTSWNPLYYMNMWSVKFSDSTLLGYAQFPNSSTLQDLNTNNGAANTDGVVSNYDVFGISQNNSTFLLNSTYNLGRTMTHEVGHWLGLRHIWGDGSGDEANNSPDCTATDYCDDTPQAGWEHYTCGTFDTCPSEIGDDMTENYMDYTPDSCMNIFTVNQKDRMTTVMNNSPRRKTLKTSTKSTAIPLFANDAEVKIETNCTLASCSLPNQIIQKGIIYNRGTANLTKATLKYTIDGGANYTNYNWTGNLATNESATFPITINTSTNGTITISVLTTNGVLDERTNIKISNNTATGTFTIPPSPSNYTDTNYTFNLQLDKWGSETSWTLKTGAGSTVRQGGSYKDDTNLPALKTFTWGLNANECYIFTIKDTMGDGICCGVTDGDGYYEIKASDGSIVKSKDISFTSSTESISFSTNTLGNSAFETSNEIFMYPNPTKTSFKIEIPSVFGLPDNYAIYNSLGAKISEKQVLNQSDLMVNTSVLNTGIYFITIEKEGAKKTLQFIKE